MSILIGVGIATTVGVIYIGKKSWHALHSAVGITPGVMVYQDPNKPLSLANMTWPQLQLNKLHLTSLTDRQLRQLQYIDSRVAIYNDYQQDMQQQNMTVALTEQQFVLHKLLQTRLPEMLGSHHRLMKQGLDKQAAGVSEISKTDEARQLLQAVLDNIERRLDALIEQMQTQHLQDLRVMKNYIDSHH